MRFFIKELLVFFAEKCFLTITKQFTQIFSSHQRLVFAKELPISVEEILKLARNC